MRPQLPLAESVLPYWREIDGARYYSNFGPLERRLKQRIASHFGETPEHVATAANATLGLTLALLAQDVKPGTLCLMPAWTFIASAQAAELAGLKPYFVDVEPETWVLQPHMAREAMRLAPGEVGAVMPVVPFGLPFDYVSWDEFHAETGLPVVIDAAAAFDTLRPGLVPSVVSLHSTKVLGIGEGAFVTTRIDGLATDIERRTNFGFRGSRTSSVAAFNAKLSEYHAAVGLAALDEWPETRADWLRVCGAYREGLSCQDQVVAQPGFGETWVSSVLVVDVLSGDAAPLEQSLNEAGIETRQWWGDGAHAHPSMAPYPRTPLPVTERLARSTLALPLHRDLPLDDVRRVCDVVPRAG